jgi:DNA-binding MarR family transcriptional regulator
MNKSAVAGNGFALLTEPEVDSQIERVMVEKVKLQGVWEELSDRKVAGIEGSSEAIQQIEQKRDDVDRHLAQLYAAKPRARQRDQERRLARIAELKVEGQALLAKLDAECSTVTEKYRRTEASVKDAWCAFRVRYAFANDMYGLIPDHCFLRGYKLPLHEGDERLVYGLKGTVVEVPGRQLIAELKQLLQKR